MVDIDGPHTALVVFSAAPGEMTTIDLTDRGDRMASPRRPERVHPDLHLAFAELLAIHEMSRLPEESLVRVLQTIPIAVLRRALAGSS